MRLRPRVPYTFKLALKHETAEETHLVSRSYHTLDSRRARLAAVVRRPLPDHRE